MRKPADPNDPNENVPEASNPPPYGVPIDLATAKKAADGAAAEAAKRKWDAFCIAVVGPSGDLVYFEGLDNCQFTSINISQHKARVAARYRRPTLAFERLLRKGAFFDYLTTLDDVIASRGGNPLIVDGKVIGGIGVRGGRFTRRFALTGRCCGAEIARSHALCRLCVLRQRI